MCPSLFCQFFSFMKINKHRYTWPSKLKMYTNDWPLTSLKLTDGWRIFNGFEDWFNVFYALTVSANTLTLFTNAATICANALMFFPSVLTFCLSALTLSEMKMWSSQLWLQFKQSQLRCVLVLSSKGWLMTPQRSERLRCGLNLSLA